MRLNLACGNAKPEGYTHVDIGKGCNPDRLIDLFRPDWWTEFGECSADQILCQHFLEHLPHDIGGRDGLIQFMEQCYRILKPGAEMEVAFPHHMSEAAFSDPTHKRFIHTTTFLYFDAPWRKTFKFDHYDINTDFEGRYGHVLSLGEAKLPVNETTLLHNWNMIHEMRIHLTAHKPMRA